RPEVLKNTLHECLFVAVIAFSAASSIFLQRSVMVIAAQIGDDLVMSPAEVAWETAAAGLTTAAFLIPFGHVADVCPPILTRKTLLLLSLTAFSLFVTFTSFAQSGVVVDIMSGLAGVACAANIPIAVGILSLAYPVSSRRKNLVFSSFLMGNPAATIIGGVSSGGLASLYSWKAPFICLGLLYASITVLAWLVIPNEPHPQDQKSTDSDELSHSFFLLLGALWRFDWTGLFLLLAGVLLFTVALTIGPEGYLPWKTPVVILLLTIGLLSLGCFILWEYFTKTPMIPPVIWEDYTVSLIFLGTLSCTMASSSSIFWVSMFLQEIENLSPFNVAVRLLPQALVGLFISPLVGLIMHKVPGTVLVGIAGLCSVTGNLLLVFLRQGNSYFTWIFPSILLTAIGMDWTLNTSQLYILSALPLKHHSIGASLLQTTRLGIPLGLAITTAVWSS
ncbi:major facilitator superfamily domain-containing protein, partial [Pseudomassariella vexata]